MINLKKKNEITKNVVQGIATLLIFLVMPSFQSVPFDLLNVDLNYVPTFVKSLYMIIYEILMIALIVFIYRDLLVEKWKDFKKNHKAYFNQYFKYWFLLLGLMMFSNLVIMLITKDSGGAENQNQIISMFAKAPIYTYVAAVFLAPFLEEMAFRQSIRNFIPKWNILFILVSGIIFGGLHVIGATDWTGWLYIIPYSIPGIIFAYVLTKTDNIFCTIGLHFVHNGILMALQAIVLIFG